MKRISKSIFWYDILCALVLRSRLARVAPTTTLGIALSHFRECLSITGGGVRGEPPSVKASTGLEGSLVHFVAYVKQGGPKPTLVPAATSSVFIPELGACTGPSHIGVYDVATLPAYRRRGLGRLMTAVAVTQGQALAPDTTVAVMQATRGGLPLYAKLGFVDTGFTSLHTREVKGALSRWKRTVSFIHFRNSSINWGAKIGTFGSCGFGAGIGYQVSRLVATGIYRST